MDKLNTNYIALLSCFKDITSEHLNHLSDVQKKTLKEALTAIRHNQPCSAKALELIKNLQTPSTDDVFYISERSLKKRIQNLFNKSISSTSLQKSINNLLKDELSQIQHTLKKYQDSLDPVQFKYIQKICQDIQKNVQKRGLTNSEVISEDEKMLFIFFEKFMEAKENLSLLDFFSKAFNQEDQSLKAQVSRLDNYQYKPEVIPKITLEFYEDNSMHLPLEDLEKPSPDGVVRLHQSYKKLLEENSPFFEKLFHSASPFLESQQKQFGLGDIKAKDLTIILKFLVQNKLSLEQPLSQEDTEKLEKLTLEPPILTLEDAQHLLPLIDRYELTKLIPIITTAIDPINTVRLLYPDKPEDLNKAIHIYQILNVAPLSPDIEELFAHFFADALSKTKSSSERKMLIQVFNEIEVRNLIFADGHKNSDLKDIDQISSLKKLTLEGDEFNKSLFSYLKNVHLDNLSLDNCNISLDHLIKYKEYDFKNLNLSTKKLNWETLNKLILQAGDLRLKSLQTNSLYDEDKDITPQATIVFIDDPSKNIKLGSQIKLITSLNKYEGEFEYTPGSRIIRKGFGKYFPGEGTVYEGEWKNDRRNGHGKEILPNGDVFEGEWENDLRHGKGEIIYANRGKYEGNWDHEKNSFGTMRYLNGNVYMGEWLREKANREGTMTYANKDVYIGNWKDNQRDGIGKMTFINGNVYKGYWKNDKRNGYGEMSYKNGNVYKGDWKDGLQHGMGKFTNHDGSITYEGEYRLGKPMIQLNSFISDVNDKVNDYIKNTPLVELTPQIVHDEFKASFSALLLEERLHLIKKWLEEPRGLLYLPYLSKEEIDAIFSSHLNDLASQCEEEPRLIISLFELKPSRLFDTDAFRNKTKERYLVQIEKTHELTESQYEVCQKCMPEISAYCDFFQACYSLIKFSQSQFILEEKLANRAKKNFWSDISYTRKIMENSNNIELQKRPEFQNLENAIYNLPEYFRTY